MYFEIMMLPTLGWKRSQFLDLNNPCFVCYPNFPLVAIKLPRSDLPCEVPCDVGFLPEGSLFGLFFFETKRGAEVGEKGQVTVHGK